MRGTISLSVGELRTVDGEAELKISVAVPYELRGEPGADSGYFLFTEPVGHQATTLWGLAALAAIAGGVCAIALIAGYPNPLLMACGIGLSAVLTVFIVHQARKIKSRELRIDTINNECFFGEADGMCSARFSLDDAQLRVVQVTARNRGREPWGFAVVVSAPVVQFPLAAVKDEALVHTYIKGLPRPLRARLIPEVGMAEVEHLWPRGLRS